MTNKQCSASMEENCRECYREALERIVDEFILYDEERCPWCGRLIKQQEKHAPDCAYLQAQQLVGKHYTYSTACPYISTQEEMDYWTEFLTVYPDVRVRYYGDHSPYGDLVYGDEVILGFADPRRALSFVRGVMFALKHKET